MSRIIRQQTWTDEALHEAGFQYYHRKKQLVMARILQDGEAPAHIQTSWGDTLIAHAGYVICYKAGKRVFPALSDYEHWPVEPHIFAQTYRTWDTTWTPSPPQRHLLACGCQPFYKAVGVHAKILEQPVYIQSLENDYPVLVDAGRVLVIGVKGEPYAMTLENFHSRYDVPDYHHHTEVEVATAAAQTPQRQRSVISRLLGFFAGR